MVGAQRQLPILLAGLQAHCRPSSKKGQQPEALCALRIEDGPGAQGTRSGRVQDKAAGKGCEGQAKEKGRQGVDLLRGLRSGVLATAHHLPLLQQRMLEAQDGVAWREATHWT